MNIIAFLRTLPDFIGGNGITDANIKQAEADLALQFSPEFRDYVLAYGIVAVDGHELTGICKSKRVNVVDVTKKQKIMMPSVSHDWYVVEEACIDGIVIWQSTSGEVYQTAPNLPPKKIADSLCEYLSD